MQNNWKGFSITAFMTGFLMSLVLLWDTFALNAQLDVLYWSVKGTTILSMFGMTYVTYKHRKTIPVFEDLYCILFYVYSFYGMACIDMTYIYSFMEAVLISALVIRQETRNFLATTLFGFFLALGGFYLTSEPEFVAPGQSYKPHAFTITFLFFAIAVTAHFVVTRYQKKFMELNEKFALIGKQSSFLMHEIKNPLNRVVANSENSFTQETMDDIRKDSIKISGLVSSIETLIHNPTQLSATFTKFDLNDIQTMLQQDYSSYIAAMNIKHDFTDLNGDFYGNKYLLFQLLKNLLMNAIEGIGYRKDEESSIHIKVSRADNKLKLTVQNSNSQISLKDLPFIFDPHFTTKKNKTNKGLGLSLSKSIVEAHYGKISASSENNLTSFVIDLPDYSKSAVKV
jgi:signal transduction histidine kinase